MEVKNDHRSNFSNLSSWKEAWKNQGFNGIRTRDHRDTGAMLYQLRSYTMIILHFFILHILWMIILHFQ